MNKVHLTLVETINHHLADAPLWHLEYKGYDLSITKRVVMMWIASVFLILLLLPIGMRARNNAYRRPSRLVSLIEILVTFYSG